MRNFFVFFGVFVLLAMVVGCDRVSNPVQTAVSVVEVESDDVDDVMARSKNWLAYTVDEVVHVNYLPDEHAGFQVISIGGVDTSPIIGVGSPLPNGYFGEDFGLVQKRFEEDIVDVDFGASIALFEGPVEKGIFEDRPFVPMVGNPAALLVVGAPEADNGAGAVFVFRIGSEGLWLEAKLSPDSGRTRGFGSEVQFLTTSDGVEYLAIQSENRAEAASYHVTSFLSIG